MKHLDTLRLGWLTLLLVATLTMWAGEQAVTVGTSVHLWDGTSVKAHGVTLTPYVPAQPTGAAVVVCPGGSYFWLDKKTEGVEVATALAQQGITAFVLHYRTAGVWRFIFHHGLLSSRKVTDPLDDAQQALRWVRSHAGQYGIDSSRVGIMGFSAGGHLAAWSAVADAQGASPAFVAAIYPVVTMTHPQWTHGRSVRGLNGGHSMGDTTLRAQLSLERQAARINVPVFLVNCLDDPVVDWHNAAMLDSALTAAGKDHEYLQYEQGGHGFGVGSSKAPWLPRFVAWLREHGIIH